MWVGILTFHAANNCGAVLQTYALCRTLEEFGCAPCVINYRPKFISMPPKPLKQHPLRIPEKVLRKLRQRQLGTALKSVVQRGRFDRFRRDFLSTTNRVYWNCGSRQSNAGELPSASAFKRYLLRRPENENLSNHNWEIQTTSARQAASDSIHNQARNNGCV